jgi:deferrochelatase/peroxidase EfeB
MPEVNNAPQPDKSNIQGMILRGFTHPFSCHMVFKFNTRAGAKSFIKAILPYVQSAENWGVDKPGMMLNIGLTFSGITIASDLTRGDMQTFPPEFQQGPISANSQASLNDYGSSLPTGWAFGNKTKQVDCVVHAYALTAAQLEQLVSLISGAAKTAGLTEYLPIDNGTKRLEEYPLMPRFSVHFGYQDGIDQPDLSWSDPPNPNDNGDLRYFLIGHPIGDSGPYPNVGNAGDFAKDGCYNAFRMLYQDSKAFDTFLDDNAESIATKLGKTPAYAKEWLAAKINGRWRNGSPLVLSPDEEDPKTSHATVFGYSGDTTGMKCPFAAHTRVGNPRDEAVFNTEPNPLPRLIRRGMAYGAPPVDKNYNGDRGLIGLFLCGSLSGQFELLYSWINATNFTPLNSNLTGQDGLIANRSKMNPPANTSYTIPTEKGPITIPHLPQFVVTRGTAYCLLPSISTLKSIAG